MNATEVREVEEAKQRSAEVAAFFDLDGTLIEGPSLERRFLQVLRYQRTIGMKNCLLWAARAVQLTPEGIAVMLQANKMYLRGVSADAAVASEAREIHFFVQGIQRLAWHVDQGHAVMIVSGTLEALARRAARELETVLSRRGIAARIEVCATRLEERDGKWTGEIVGEAMYGGAKARAVRKLAAKLGFDLRRSYGYGNSLHDRWLLGSVGRPVAVNPSQDFKRIARQKNWPVMWWNKREIETQGRPDEIGASSEHREKSVIRPELAQRERESLG